jgi:hypothetical protein
MDTFKLKDGMTTEALAEKLIRSYLIRCHRRVSKDFPEISGMDPTHAADFLMHLRKTGRITITLFNDGPTNIGCKIVDLNSATDVVEQRNAGGSPNV